MEHKKNGHLYELTTNRDYKLIRITRDGEVIHVQFNTMTDIKGYKDKGFKDLNEITGDFSSYIDFCETKQYYRKATITSDEWSKRTSIMANLYYRGDEEPEKLYYIDREVDSVRGSMSGFSSRADDAIDACWDFMNNTKQEQ